MRDWGDRHSHDRPHVSGRTAARPASYSMADFYEEMRRRGVNRRPNRVALRDRRPRLQAAERVAPRPESMRIFLGRTAAAVRARIAELLQHDARDVMPCPWGAIDDAPPCSRTCRCNATGAVSVGALLEHYRQLEAELDEQRGMR